jgi:hypothetical protein
MKKLKIVTHFSIIAMACTLCFIACGGGGSGGGESSLSPAQVSIDAAPKNIDSGDRIRVKIFLADIPNDGVLLKLRYSSRLAYVKSSGQLRVSEALGTIDPGVNVTLGQAVKKSYLVFDLPHEVFGDFSNAELELLLEGQGRISNGRIEVDSDINDPSLTIDEKFSSLQPEFNTLDFEEVDVNDESGQIPPTPTYTPTITPTPAATATATTASSS